MANRIGPLCINCGACVPECKRQAISPGDDCHVIDADRCDECAANAGGPCCMAVCPTSCISAAAPGGSEVRGDAGP